MLILQCSSRLWSQFYVGRTAAVDGSDYDGQSNVLLTFNADTTSIEVPVNITDDSLYDGEEDFSGTLTLVSDSPRVIFDPSNAVATILNDECIRTTFVEYKQISCLQRCSI